MKSLKKTISLIFLMYHGLVGALIGLLIYFIGHFVFSENELIKELANSLGSTFIVGSIFGLLYTNLARKIYYNEMKYLMDREESGFQKVFPRSNDQRLTEVLAYQIISSKEIKMYGIAINALWNDKVIENLKRVAKGRQSKVSIFLADVESEQIKIRLEEEKQQKRTTPRRHGKEVISEVYEFMKKIELEINLPDFFRVQKFNHYPTFALLMVDEDLYYYPYGFQTEGTHSPLFHFKRNNGSISNYFENQFNLLEINYFESNQAK